MTEAHLREGTVELDGSFVFVLLFSSVYVSYSPLLGGLATQTANASVRTSTSKVDLGSWKLPVWTYLCLLFSVLAVCGMVLGVWHAPIDLYGHPVPPDFANVACLMCWFWFGPAAAGLGFLALGDLLTNSSVPEDHKRFTLVCVAAGAVVVVILGLYFVYETVRWGIFWCGSLADMQTSRYVSHGIQLLICASGLLAICIVSLVRRLEKRRELPSKDLAELMREARMRRTRMGVALAVVVIPSLLLMTAVLPRTLSFTATGISTEMSRPSIDEFDEAYMKTINVRVAGVVLHFYPYTLIFYGLLEFIAVTAVTAASNQSFGHFAPIGRDEGRTADNARHSCGHDAVVRVLDSFKPKVSAFDSVQPLYVVVTASVIHRILHERGQGGFQQPQRVPWLRVSE